MAHSPDLVALFGFFAVLAHAPSAETRGLQHADREDVAQDALLLLWPTLRGSGAAAVGAGAQVLGGILRNLTRNVKRRKQRSRQWRRLQGLSKLSEPDLEAVTAPAAELPQDWREALTANERTWVDGFESRACDQDLAVAWRVHRTTVVRRRIGLLRRLGDLLRGYGSRLPCV